MDMKQTITPNAITPATDNPDDPAYRGIRNDQPRRGVLRSMVERIYVGSSRSALDRAEVRAAARADR